MIEKGICRICGKDGFVIDTIAICSNCIMKAMQDPRISKETRQGLKWLCNMQYGALAMPSSRSRMSEPIKGVVDMINNKQRVGKAMDNWHFDPTVDHENMNDTILVKTPVKGDIIKKTPRERFWCPDCGRDWEMYADWTWSYETAMDGVPVQHCPNCQK